MQDGLPVAAATDTSELLEEPPKTSGNTSASVESEQKLNIKSKSPRRVKVYLLLGEDWLDNGTGYCMGQVDSESHKPYFIVRNELDSEEVILKSFLEGSIQYQRQQETLIVWTDLTGKDLALSFQENEGCADLCEFIVKVQQENLSPMISLYYVLSTMQEVSGDGLREVTELVTGPITYPPKSPSKDSLEEVLEIINQGSNSQYTRSHIARYLIEESYLEELFRIFNIAEQDRDLPTLHQLSDIIKILLVYNEPNLLEELIGSQHNVLGFVGILEYDRDYPKFKACYREYLLDESKFKSVVDIPQPPKAANADMSIFRRDFILNYLKNVVLARNLDDQTLNTLSSLIYNNQLDIIQFLKDSKANDNFLSRLFALYDLNEESLIQKRRDGLKMLHQYVLVAKGHQASQRPEFYSTLVRSGLFKMVKFALRDTESNIRVVGTELLVTIIEQDVSLVNSVAMEDKVDELELPVANDLPNGEDEAHPNENSESLALNLVGEMSLTLVLGQLLLEDKNPGLKIQAYEAIKTLLCSASASAENHNENDSDQEGNGNEDAAESNSAQRYFEAFYEQVAPVLFRDFIDLASDDPKKFEAAEKKVKSDPILYQHLCDLISFCCREHEPSICRPFFFENHVLKGILRILSTKLKITLKLGVMRCLKSIILLNDYPFCRYLIDNNLFKDYFIFFNSVANENSLANSLCLDLLEIIIRRSLGENYRQLAIHIYHSYKSFLESQIDYVSTGRDLVQTVESHVQQLNDPTATSVDAEQMNYADNPSSPIRKEDEALPVKGSHNMFENIQKELSGTKRTNEDRTDEADKESAEDSESSLISHKRVSLSISDDALLELSHNSNHSVTT